MSTTDDIQWALCFDELTEAIRSAQSGNIRYLHANADRRVFPFDGPATRESIPIIDLHEWGGAGVSALDAELLAVDIMVLNNESIADHLDRAFPTS